MQLGSCHPNVYKHTHTHTYTQHPLVSPLLAGLLSPSLPTAHACCSALVAAVTHSWVARHASIAALVTHAATTKAYPLAVGAISELLLYEVKAAEAEYQCPYSLRCVCTFYFCICAYALLLNYSSFFGDLQDKYPPLHFCPECSS